MPDLARAKSVSICQISDESKLTRICDLVEPSTVKRICSGIAASEVRPGKKIVLEPGPVLVIVDGTGKPLIAFMQKLDGWLAAFAVDRNNQEWVLGKALMEREEYRRPTPDYPCWDLVYKVWLHTVNPELYKAEQAVPSDGHKPSNHASSTNPTAPADAH